ncbi:hypothetical protein [Chryseobacterium sp.]|uniref:hypothetical protein n=1 Tax=Chryseobacterium sp. TaxID=1871047 RepID=UPI00289D0427|nr:hypothetical protein [Chryseobacterium sp.]
MKNVLNLLVIPIFLLCSFQKEKNDQQRTETESVSPVKSERIIYLFFKTDKDQSGNEKVILQNSKISEGKLKLQPSFDRDDAQKGDYIITVAESGGKALSRQLIKDPLNPVMEVYEKEGISRHKASLQSTEFSARFSYSENVQLVRVEKVTDSGVQLLFTKKLES